MNTNGTKDGVQIQFASDVTTEQRELAQQTLLEHIAEDYQDRRRVAYERNGLSAEVLLIALWERVVEGRSEASEALQAIREKVKQQFPKTSG